MKEIIEIDPPLTGRLLKLANSAYYAPRTRISEILQAIIWVGYDTLKELALSQKVFEIFDGDTSIEGYSRTSLWKHCVAVAVLGKMIYRREFGEKGENIYVAGLLHEIGIIALDQFRQGDFRHIITKTRTENKNQAEAEREQLGFDHAEVGRAITRDWNLPQELVQVIGCHHNPNVILQKSARTGFTLYVADYVCQEREIGYRDALNLDKKTFMRCLENLNLKSYTLDILMADVEEELLKMEDQGIF